jgi:hypothetical protein
MMRELGPFVLAGTILVGCSFKPGPAGTVKQFINDVADGNVTEAVQLVNSPPGMEAKISFALTAAAKEAHEKGKVVSIDILKEDIQGELAHVDYVVHQKDDKPGEKEKSHTDLQKIDGKWKISLLQ